MSAAMALGPVTAALVVNIVRGAAWTTTLTAKDEAGGPVPWAAAPVLELWAHASTITWPSVLSGGDSVATITRTAAEVTALLAARPTWARLLIGSGPVVIGSGKVVVHA